MKRGLQVMSLGVLLIVFSQWATGCGIKKQDDKTQAKQVLKDLVTAVREENPDKVSELVIGDGPKAEAYESQLKAWVLARVAGLALINEVRSRFGTVAANRMASELGVAGGVLYGDLDNIANAHLVIEQAQEGRTEPSHAVADMVGTTQKFYMHKIDGQWGFDGEACLAPWTDAEITAALQLTREFTQVIEQQTQKLRATADAERVREFKTFLEETRMQLNSVGSSIQ